MATTGIHDPRRRPSSEVRRHRARCEPRYIDPCRSISLVSVWSSSGQNSAFDIASELARASPQAQVFLFGHPATVVVASRARPTYRPSRSLREALNEAVLPRERSGASRTPRAPDARDRDEPPRVDQHNRIRAVGSVSAIEQRLDTMHPTLSDVLPHFRTSSFLPRRQNARQDQHGPRSARRPNGSAF